MFMSVMTVEKRRMKFPLIWIWPWSNWCWLILTEQKLHPMGRRLHGLDAVLQMPYVSIDGRNCAIVKKKAPLSPPRRKKRRFFTKYHFLKGSKCSVFGFGLSLVFSHFASCGKFVISCKSCKTRVVCFCFGHSLNPLFLLWSDFREVLNVLLILGILTSEMV